MCDVVIQVDNLRKKSNAGVNQSVRHNMADFKQLSCISSSVSDRIEMKKIQVLEVIKVQGDVVILLITKAQHEHARVNQLTR